MPAGLPRLTQVVLSCLRVPSSLCPNVSSDFFFLSLPPSSSSLPTPWFNTGKMVTLPSFLPSAFMDHQLTSRFLLFSLCVCLFKLLFFLLPFSFCPPPLLPCNWRMCYEVANSWTVRLLFFQMPPCLPSLPLPSPSFILLEH